MVKTTLFFVASAALGATAVVSKPLFGQQEDPLKKTSDKSVGAGNASRIKVNVPLGHVTLIADNSRNLTVHAVRSTKEPLTEQSKKWMKDSFVTAENRNGVLEVRDHPFGKDSLNDLHWENQRGSDHDGQDLTLNLEIHVPSNLAAGLEVTAGGAEMRGRYSSIDARISAGNLRIDKAECDGKADLRVGAGKLEASLERGARGATRLDVGAGQVNLAVPSGSSADINANVGVGHITGLPSAQEKKGGIQLGDKRHARTGQGDCKVDIHVGAGSIKIDSPEHMASMKVSAADNDQDLGIPKDLDKEIASAVSEALSESSKALNFAQGDFKFDLKDLKDLDLKDLKELKDLKGLDHDMDLKELKELDGLKDLKNLKIDLDLKSLENLKDLEDMQDLKDLKDLKKLEKLDGFKGLSKKDLAEIDKAVSKAMAEVGPAVEKAMKKVKPEIEAAIRKAMKAIEQAQREIDKATRDLDKREKTESKS